MFTALQIDLQLLKKVAEQKFGGFVVVIEHKNPKL